MRAEDRRLLHVLVVDDDDGVRAVVARRLMRAGMVVSTAATGRAGLEAAAASRGKLGVIVLDLKLPDLSGLEVLKRLRSDGDMTPVLVLTGHATTQTAFEVGTYPHTAYREKPLQTGALLTAITRAADGAGRPAATGRPSETSPNDLGLGTCLESLATLQLSRAAATNGTRTDRTPLLRGLAEVIACRRASFYLIIAACRSFREVTMASEEHLHDLLAVVRDWLVTAAVRRWSNADHPFVPFAELVPAPVSTERLREIASEMNGVGLGEEDLDAVLGREVGVSSAYLRLMARARPVVMALLMTTEHVAQIGYAHGYLHPSQVDRDLRRLLGVSPRELRGIRLAGSRPGRVADWFRGCGPDTR